MPVLAFLPLWAIMYVNTLSQAAQHRAHPTRGGYHRVRQPVPELPRGRRLGGAGRPLTRRPDGVLTTFPYIADQLEFVWQGSAGTGPKGTKYGSETKPGGQHAMLSYDGVTLMPTFKGPITQTELLEVVRHERETFGGEKVPSDQIAPTGALLWPNKTPLINSSGVLVDPEGNPLFDDEGKLANPTLVHSGGGHDATSPDPASRSRFA